MRNVEVRTPLKIAASLMSMASKHYGLLYFSKVGSFVAAMVNSLAASDPAQAAWTFVINRDSQKSNAYALCNPLIIQDSETN